MRATLDNLTNVKLKQVEIDLPELGEGVTVLLQQLPGTALDAFKSGNLTSKDFAKVIIASFADPIIPLSDANVNMVLAWPMELLNKFIAEMANLNGFSDDVRKQLEKN